MAKKTKRRRHRGVVIVNGWKYIPRNRCCSYDQTITESIFITYHWLLNEESNLRSRPCISLLFVCCCWCGLFLLFEFATGITRFSLHRSTATIALAGTLCELASGVGTGLNGRILGRGKVVFGLLNGRQIRSGHDCDGEVVGMNEWMNWLNDWLNDWLIDKGKEW